MKGKVYKITNTINTLIYVGSTFKNLDMRFLAHLHRMSTAPNRKFYKAIKELGWRKFDIILIEEVEVNNKKDLLKYEDKWIRQLNSIINGYNCIYSYSYTNKDHPKHKIYKKDEANRVRNYYKKNPELKRISEKKYRIKNREILNKKSSEYQKKHIIERNKYKLEWSHKNPEKKKLATKKYEEKMKQKGKYKCECGKEINYLGIKKHKQTKYHLKRI